MIVDDKKKNFHVQAMLVLKKMQQRDMPHMEWQMDMKKDEIITDLSFGRLALSIPYDHYEVLTMMFPDLQHEDATEQTLAWKAFMTTDLSAPYKVNTKQRSI